MNEDALLPDAKRKGRRKTWWEVGLCCIQSQEVGPLSPHMREDPLSCLERGTLGLDLSDVVFWGRISCLAWETSPLLAQLAPGAQVLTEGRDALSTPCRVTS